MTQKITKEQAKEQLREALNNAYAQGGAEAYSAIMPVMRQIHGQLGTLIDAAEKVIQEHKELTSNVTSQNN